MSTYNQVILPYIPPGDGIVLDLGGGQGGLRDPLMRMGYRYVNLDVDLGSRSGAHYLIGDAHVLPFKDETFSLVVSKDSLEHFSRPQEAIREVERVLMPGGHFVIAVPFIHPFHGDDFYRYSPMGIRFLLSEVSSFEILRLESPMWIFSIISTMLCEVLGRLHLAGMARAARSFGLFLDAIANRSRPAPRSYAASYLVVARKSA